MAICHLGANVSLCPANGYVHQWKAQKIKTKMFKKSRKIKIGQSIQSGFYTAEENTLMPIAFCMGNHVPEAEIFSHSEKAAHTIMNLAGADDALVLYWDSAEPDLPYKFVATCRRVPGLKF